MPSNKPPKMQPLIIMLIISSLFSLKACGVTGAPQLHKPLNLLGSEGDSGHGLLLEMEGQEGKLTSVNVTLSLFLYCGH